MMRQFNDSRKIITKWLPRSVIIFCVVFTVISIYDRKNLRGEVNNRRIEIEAAQKAADLTIEMRNARAEIFLILIEACKRERVCSPEEIERIRALEKSAEFDLVK